MAMNVKNKLINTTHFYERSSLEISDPLLHIFPYYKGNPFEDVTYVVWLLRTGFSGILASGQKKWILISATLTIDSTLLCQSSGPQLCWWGTSWKVVLAYSSQSQRALLHEETWLSDVWKGSYLLHPPWGCLVALGAGKGITNPLRLISSLSQQVLFYPDLGVGV